MKSQVIKRSVVLNGHKTSISLEDAFCSSLKAIAQAQGATVSQTVTEIDKTRRGEACPPRSACSSSTKSVQKKWGPPLDNGGPNQRRQFRGLAASTTHTTVTHSHNSNAYLTRRPRERSRWIART